MNRFRGLFRKVYAYHVVYSFSNGRGSIQITRTGKIKKYEHVLEMVDIINKKTGEKVVIENWISIKPSADMLKDLNLTK